MYCSCAKVLPNASTGKTTLGMSIVIPGKKVRPAMTREGYEERIKSTIPGAVGNEDRAD